MNNEKREKLFRVARNHRMNDLTDKKLELFKQAKENVVNDMPQFFDIAKTIVERSYPKDDVATLQTFKIKYGSPCDVVAKDSCFYFAYTDQDNVDDEGKPIENKKHFDFKLNGSLNGSEYNREVDFGYAFFRDELIAENCNPDINIEQEDNQHNPHWTKHTDQNDKVIKSFEQDWQEKYQVDVIGTSYCRSRSIACTHNEFIKGVQLDMNDVKGVLKSMSYLDSGIEFVNEFAQSNIVDEAQVIRTDGMGLTIYNPENALQRIMERRKAQPTREEKIAIAMQMQQEQALN